MLLSRGRGVCHGGDRGIVRILHWLRTESSTSDRVAASELATSSSEIAKSKHRSEAPVAGGRHENKQLQSSANDKTSESFPQEFRFLFPDFLPRPDFGTRHPLREKLERYDMFRRREYVGVPEFYVGSVLAVTVSDKFAAGKTNRFVGICILREYSGLRHYFILRNVIDGLGFEIKYDLYNPLVQKIEVLKLEKRVDSHLLYLRDALPEYSTFPFNMEPIPHPAGAPVPINPLKVEMRQPPWHQRWEIKNMQGILPFDQMLNEVNLKRKAKTIIEWWREYDLMENYRNEIPAEDQTKIFAEMEAEQKKISATNWKQKTRTF